MSIAPKNHVDKIRRGAAWFLPWMLFPILLCLLGADGLAESIRLAWIGQENVAGYHVYRSQTSGKGYARLTNLPILVPYYVDITATPPGTFYYVTTSVDAYGRESAFSEEIKAVLGSYDPNPETTTLALRAIPGSTADTGQMVILAGSVWNPESENLRFSWQQTQGPMVTVIGATNPDAVFVAPAVASDTALRFRLTVSDGKDTSVTDTIEITVHKN